ncbi:transcription termination factor, mitochondrial isoform X2 [Drosophila obscura]|uniref:transcription termination factor, mitochondrial isoform X1 n=1 Tax=Drosophila obscura TaxID=7282 RepID=UPI001BB255BF|nr:transcription termination factor, mitochondrial isoform X1 [Drosophila obscura]XP_022223336.2 transcription termination factor, mitochondrial isoform X2 [Drosophila obscura]
MSQVFGMLRNLMRSFEITLRLHSTTAIAPVLATAATVGCARRTLFTYEYESHARAKKSLLTATATTTASPGNEADNDYVPYRLEQETGTKASVLIDTLKERFRLTEAELQRIMGDDSVHRNYRSRSLTMTLDQLELEGVSKRSFVEYPWLLSLDNKRLHLKLQLIKSMNIRDINHFVPFLRLTVPRLRKLVTALNTEMKTIPQQNRVYYISESLQVSPEIVTKYLSKRLFILEMPYEMFEKNLQHMIDYNVSPINILKDLWAFRYTPRSVQVRLERAKRAKKDKIMPWMVRCPEPILQRSLKLSLDELQVLGKHSSVVEYLGHRLGFSVVETKGIMDRHPQVHTVRVTKIKEVLDYLLDEAKFTRFEIAQNPRILCHSLKTTQARVEELKSHGCRPSSLVIVCRSRREYEKFLQHWLSQVRYQQTPADP